jgi:hypothetical protein
VAGVASFSIFFFFFRLKLTLHGKATSGLIGRRYFLFLVQQTPVAQQPTELLPRAAAPPRSRPDVVEECYAGSRCWTWPPLCLTRCADARTRSGCFAVLLSHASLRTFLLCAGCGKDSGRGQPHGRCGGRPV